MQLALAMGVPTLAVMIGVLINNSPLTDLNGRLTELRNYIDVRFAGRICRDGYEIIRPANLKPMPGVVKQSNIGTNELIAKTLNNRIKRRFVQINLGAATDKHET